MRRPPPAPARRRTAGLAAARPTAALVVLALLAAACGSTVELGDAGDAPSDTTTLAAAEGLDAGLAVPGATRPGPGAAPTGSGGPTGSAGTSIATTGRPTGGAATGGAGTAPSGLGSGQGSPGSPGSPGTPPPAQGGSATDGTPFRLGFTIMDASGLEAFGNTGGEDVGSSDSEQRSGAAAAEIDALVRWANDTGGLGGRPIEALTRTVTVTDASDEAAMGAHCAGATQDQQVEAFIDATAFGNDASTVQCFANARVPLIAGTLSFHHGDYIRSVAPYVASTTATVDRIGAALVPGLDAAGYFEGAAQVGVLLDDVADVTRAYEEQIAPALAARGIQPSIFRFSTGGAESGSQGPGAVLQMRTEGVTHVISLISFLNYLGFIAAADAQGYRPRYGFSDYAEGASIAAFYGSESQNAGAVAVSSSDLYVLDPAQARPRGLDDPLDPRFMSPGLIRCADILSEYRGEDYYRSGADRSLSWAFVCNNFFLFVDAARLVEGPVTGDTWHTGLARLGAYQSTFTIGTDFGPGVFDGASQYVIGLYSDVPGCKCFVRQGPPLAFPARS